MQSDIIEEIFSNDYNRYCFDCGAKEPNWASINNAIFLCLSCAGIHRGYGVSISYIRSITMDLW